MVIVAVCTVCACAVDGVFVRRRPVASVSEHPQAFDNLVERVAKLTTHGAVEQKADRCVEQRDHVDQVAERHVHVLVEVVAEHDVEEGEQRLRKLGDQKEYAHGGEHERGAHVVVDTILRAFCLVVVARGSISSIGGGGGLFLFLQHGQLDKRGRLHRFE